MVCAPSGFRYEDNTITIRVNGLEIKPGFVAIDCSRSPIADAEKASKESGYGEAGCCLRLQ